MNKISYFWSSVVTLFPLILFVLIFVSIAVICGAVDFWRGSIDLFMVELFCLTIPAMVVARYIKASKEEGYENR
jgi:uncharacterized membrane protein